MLYICETVRVFTMCTEEEGKQGDQTETIIHTSGHLLLSVSSLENTLSLSVCLRGLFRVVLQENVTWLVGYIYMCRCGLDAAPCVHRLPWR